MKRYNIDAPCNNQYEEHPEGEWVSYEDAKEALEMFESVKLGRLFWDAVDDGHPAVDLLRRVCADWNRPDEWARDVAIYLEKIGTKP